MKDRESRYLKTTSFDDIRCLRKNLVSIGVRDMDFTPGDICPDRLNSFFTSSSNVLRLKVQRSTDNFVPTTRSFAFSNVNSRDVFIAIHQKDSNAIGLDEVPLKLLPSIFPVITHIFNTSITFGSCCKSLKST
jgi:hypothetical protein